MCAEALVVPMYVSGEEAGNGARLGGGGCRGEVLSLQVGETRRHVGEGYFGLCVRVGRDGCVEAHDRFVFFCGVMGSIEKAAY